MKKKVLLVLLILNIFPIFVVAQTSISTDTVKINTLQEIEILKNEIASLKDNIESIDKKSLKSEDIEVVLEQNKKEEKNSPIWMITLVVSLYVGIFIFLAISIESMKNFPYSVVQLLERKLKAIIIASFIGIVILVLFIFLSDDSSYYMFFTLVNIVNAGICAIKSIEYLNIYKLHKEMFKSNSIGKDIIEFYINKKEFIVAYDLLKNIQIHADTQKIKKTIQELQDLLKSTNLLDDEQIFSQFFIEYTEILFKTQDFNFIKNEINRFLNYIAELRKRLDENSQKIYENGNKNIVFLVKKSIINSNKNNENNLVEFIIEKFVSFVDRLSVDNKEDCIRIMFGEMKKIILLREFSESHFKILNNELKKILTKRHSNMKINYIIMYFLYRVIINCMKRNISSKLIIDLIKDEYDFVVNKCADSHWSKKYLTDFKKTNTKEDIAEFLKQY